MISPCSLLIYGVTWMQYKIVLKEENSVSDSEKFVSICRSKPSVVSKCCPEGSRGSTVA